MATKRPPKASFRLPTKATPSGTATKQLLSDIRGLIESAQEQTAQAVNARLVIWYWSIGNRIHRDILKQKRTEYGEEIVQTVSGQLEAEYSREFSRRNLFNMLHVAKVFSIDQTSSRRNSQPETPPLLETHPSSSPPSSDRIARRSCNMEYSSL